MSENTSSVVVESTNGTPADVTVENPVVMPPADLFEIPEDAPTVPATPAPSGNVVQDAKATLVAHTRGARKVTLEELKELETPPATSTHTPVPHYSLAAALINALQGKGLTVDKTDFALAKNNQQIFGVLKTTKTVSSGDYCVALGFRAANDKRMSIQVNAGINVFVCDNMAFNADTIIGKIPHYGGLEIVPHAEWTATQFMKKFNSLYKSVNAWKELKVTPETAWETIYNAVYGDEKEGFGFLPQKLLPVVKEEFFAPKHKYIAPGSVWHLNNAFTWAIKELEPVPQNKCLLDTDLYFCKVFNKTQAA